MRDQDIQLDILNECMGALGQFPMSDPETPQTNIERWAVNRMTNVIREVLELRPWTATLTEARISRLTERSPARNHYQYQLPQDVVRLNDIYSLTSQDYTVMDDRIVTRFRLEGMIILYNSDQMRPSWGSNLRALIGQKLALKITKPNEESAAERRALMDLIRLTMRKALSLIHI